MGSNNMKAKLKKRNSKITLVLFAVLFAAIGGYFIINSFAATPTQTANIWIDSDGGSCLDDGGHAYDTLTACSPDQANDTCEGGDTALIMGGAYGAKWKITGSNSRNSMCTMIVADSQQVTLDNLDLGTYNGGDTGPDWLTIKGNASCDSSTTGNSSCSIVAQSFDADRVSNVTLDGVEIYYANDTDTAGQIAHAEESTDFVFRNGSIHDGNGGGGMVFVAGDGPTTFENSKIYDSLYSQACLDAADPCHSECLYLNQVSNFTIRNVHMWSCVTQGIFFTCSGGTACTPGNHYNMTNIKIENSILQRTNPPASHADSALWLTNPNLYLVNSTIRNNIIVGATIDTGGGSGNLVYSNVLFGSPPCGIIGTTYSYNVSPTGTSNCGGTGAQSFALTGTASISAGMVNPSFIQTGSDTTSGTKGDFTTKAGSPLIDIGNPNLYPTDDILGNTRYKGSAPDIGPYEFGATTGLPAQTANIWVDTNGGTCQRSAPDTYANLDAKSCSSPQAAYNAASPNDLVLIQQGNYTASFSGGTKSPNVTLKAVDGSTSVGNPTKPSLRAAVKIGAISLGNNTGHFVLDGVEFDGLTMPGNDTGPSQSWSNFTILNSTQTADSVMRFSACTSLNANVLMDNNYHPGVTGPDFPDGRISFFGPYDEYAGSDFCDVKIQNSYFSGGYRDGIFVVGPQGIQILSNTFTNMGPGNTGNHTDAVQCVGGCQMTVDHNYFGHSGQGQMQGYSCFDGCYQEKVTNNVFDLGTGASFETLTLSSDDNSTVDHNTLATGVTCVFTVPCGQITLGHKPPATDCSSTCSDPSVGTTITNNIAAGISVRTNGRTGDTAKLIDYNLVTGSVSGIAGDNVGTHNADGTATYIGPPSGSNTSAFNAFNLYKLASGSLGKGAGVNNKDIGVDFGGTTPTCTKQADINCDNNVNVTDLSILLSNYGKTTAQLTSSTPSYPRADINSSGKVDIGDLSALLTGYGK
jgi:hypothetical protein